ncbi:MAG: 4Fe-4S dicluster domain-containing protein [Prolixibacteraceae bacterium]|jgi:heterodisulfide reductase subunit C|nr:4Fe-4S dicluster domain-containing protein [Prolixibacteraceae bacterium]
MGHTNKVSDLQSHTGVEVMRCYQCGKCTAGCVLASEMNYPPSYLMRLLQTGTKPNLDKVLSSNSIWLCLNCENCLGRCPMEIDIPKMMDYLRTQAIKENKLHPDSKPIIAFHKSFLDSIKNTGRLYEMGLVLSYKFRTFNFLQDLSIAPSMYLKGKLHLLPEKIKDRRSMKRIFGQTIENAKTDNK